jgi:hypothetical protein
MSLYPLIIILYLSSPLIKYSVFEWRREIEEDDQRVEGHEVGSNT